jgi:hypothetical protein
MSDSQRFGNQFDRADINHDGTTDEQEFRQLVEPIINERRLFGTANRS